MSVIDYREIFTSTKCGFFHPFAPSLAQIHVEDIVRSLSATCRWRWHTCGVLSVAEHSVMVARQVAPEYRLHALLHDAGEAYLMDVPAPVKPFTFFRVPTVGGGTLELSFDDVEMAILDVVFAAVGLAPGPLPEEVHRADMRVREWEWDTLVVPRESEFVPMEPAEAFASWMFFYERWKDEAASLVAAPRAMEVGVN